LAGSRLTDTGQKQTVNQTEMITMRRKTVINYEVVKKLFDQNLDHCVDASYFKINGGLEPITINIPASIMHRLFRLGQAYDIRKLRYLEPNVKLIVGSTEIADFVRDLARLKKLVNDEVTHHYADQLLSSINDGAHVTEKHITISTGDF
jgi:hypothetical protein